MFPLRSGIGSVNTPNTEQVLYQSIAASAMHEIGQQAIIDASLLMFHQQAAEVYFREEQGITLNTLSDGSYDLYTPEEETEIRKALVDVVMKFHILDENGLAAKLTPLIRHMETKEALSLEVQNDPFIHNILENHQQYGSALLQRNIMEVVKKVNTFTSLDRLSTDDSTKMIIDSYKEDSDTVDIAIFEDDTVQCACEFCESFFQIMEKQSSINRDNLNAVQKIMAEKYNF